VPCWIVRPSIVITNYLTLNQLTFDSTYRGRLTMAKWNVIVLRGPL
jgi:hypothetical protein